MDALDKLLAEIDAKPQQKIPAPVNKKKSVESTADMDSLLNVVKADYAQKTREIEQQKVQKIEKQAIAWLKTLDPMSSEGLWFEQFATKYPSKVAAAIDYLRSRF